MKTIARWKNVANLGQNMILGDAQFSPAAGTSIWDGCPILAMIQDPRVGILYHEDFLTLPIDDTTGNPLGWKWVSDTATGAVTLPKVAGGVVQVACGGVDNNETYIGLGAIGGDTAAPFFITDANSKPFWAEFYVKASAHADEAFFVGLAEEASAAANFLADNTGVPADKDFIGFRTKCDASAEWDVAWRKNGQAEQEIAAAAVNADDWHRFGIHYDGLHTVTFYIDGTAHATVALTSAATFPSAQALAPIIAVKTGEGVAKSIQVDYIRIAQIR